MKMLTIFTMLIACQICCSTSLLAAQKISQGSTWGRLGSSMGEGLSKGYEDGIRQQQELEYYRQQQELAYIRQQQELALLERERQIQLEILERKRQIQMETLESQRQVR